MVIGEYAKKRDYYREYMRKYMREIYVPKNREEMRIRSRNYRLRNLIKYKLYNRNRRERLKEEGCCIICAKVKVDTSYVKCIECRGKLFK